MKPSHRTASPANEAIDDLRSLILEAEKALSTNANGDNSSDKLADIKERLQAAVDQGKSTFERWREIAKTQAGRADDIVRSRPYHTAGVALGIGLVLGLILSPRRGGA
jgi:ElaB/YqjD/DUF883 family membrane-anchored ribosome-binding protein